MNSAVLSEQEQEQKIIDEFLDSTTLFLGPDPAIMNEHDLFPRSEDEQRVLAQGYDPDLLSQVRDTLQAGSNEAFDMLEQMGAAPGAKWGDLITGVYTASGDLVVPSTGGVLIFASLAHHALKFINKYWTNEPTVGVREGDIFMHNDSRYGNVHNTDQAMYLPIFRDGRLVAWTGAIVHEGENGACEPGGMPSAAESVYDEGLKISPFKVGENHALRKDLVTFLQNCVREPKLQFEDMKAKLFACKRMEERVHAAIDFYGADVVTAAMRQGLEDVREEVKRRIRAYPDATIRTHVIADGTLRENVAVKVNLELTCKGDELILDYRGSSPEFTNRANNTVLASLKGMICQLFLSFVWPDLPRNQAVFAPIQVICDPKSAVNSSYDTPNAQSMMTFFPAFCTAQKAIAHLIYPSQQKYTKVVAPWFCMISTFIYGGVTQRGEVVGNLCADLNGMGGGARADQDGEHGIAPIFASMSDTGEQEINEEEVPFLQLVSKKLLRDNQGFGKYRGGMGYEMMVATKDSEFWGFMVTCLGSKFPITKGLFGGYACPTYPLCKVKGEDMYEVMKHTPEKFRHSMVEVMNEQPFENAKYSTHHMGMQYELAKRGELYMITQGSGGGYGDVLERDPELALTDLGNGLISHDVAQRVYKLVYDEETLALDAEATHAARDAERDDRKRRGLSYDDFLAKHVSDTPPAYPAFYGSWNGDRDTIYHGRPDHKTTADAIEPIMMPDPKDVRIAELEAQLAARGG
ncbi:MAG: hydantoinase B/oxoprolinase family protein [Salinisphaera sp.]|nr:hydantoinase B/oxoprolinase family protein [Salinisphaera sp.]